MENYVVPLTFLVLGLSQVSMMIYYWHFGKQVKQMGREATDKSSELKAENDSWELLHRAIKKSQAIVGEAEIESIKNQSTIFKGVRDFGNKYEKELELTASDVQKQLMAETAKATEEFKQQLVKQTQLVKELGYEVDETVKKNVEMMLVKFGKDLSEKLAEVEAKSLALADAEVESMKKAIEEYKKRRMSHIDDEAVQIISKAMTLLVQKDFSADQHLDAIKESLEEAKGEHFI